MDGAAGRIIAFPCVLILFYSLGMARFDTALASAATDISAAILSAPGWARVGITAPNERLRHDAAHELARAILNGSAGGPDPAQLPLAL